MNHGNEVLEKIKNNLGTLVSSASGRGGGTGPTRAAGVASWQLLDCPTGVAGWPMLVAALAGLPLAGTPLVIAGVGNAMFFAGTPLQLANPVGFWLAKVMLGCSWDAMLCKMVVKPWMASPRSVWAGWCCSGMCCCTSALVLLVFTLVRSHYRAAKWTII